MPKPGGFIKIGNEQFLVKRQNPLQESIIVGSQAGEERLLEKREWQTFEQLKIEKSAKRKRTEEE